MGLADYGRAYSVRIGGERRVRPNFKMVLSKWITF